MRISTSYQYEVYDSDIQASQQKLFNAQQQETTGLAINTPSDNPIGAKQVLNMQSIQNSLTQYQTNITGATSVLKSSDAALQTATTTMNSANTVALQASSSATMDDTTRQNLIAQVSSLQQNLLASANAQGPDGQYLFAGQKTDTKPFTVDSTGQLTYSGDKNSVSVTAGPNDSIAINVPGDPTFTDAYNALQSLKTNLQANNTTAISNTDVANIKAASTGISQADGQVGAIQVQMSNLSNFNSRRITDLTSDVSSVKNINAATAATNYASATNAYQAALTVVGKASQLSLMNYLSSNL